MTLSRETQDNKYNSYNLRLLYKDYFIHLVHRRQLHLLDHALLLAKLGVAPPHSSMAFRKPTRILTRGNLLYLMF